MFHSRPPTLPEDDALAEIQQHGEAQLAPQGYRQYEVSAFAQDGQQCRHNLNYWRFGDYLAIGAGAHGKVTLAAEERVIRTRRTRVPRDYLGSVAAARREIVTVSATELPLEFLMNGLRLCDGVTTADFEDRTGLSAESVHAVAASLRHRGLLVDDENRFCTTPTGFRFLDSVLAAFA